MVTKSITMQLSASKMGLRVIMGPLCGPRVCYSSDAAKASTATISESAARPFQVGGKPSVTINPDPLKVTIPKIDLTSVTPHISKPKQADPFKTAVSFDAIPGPLSLQFLAKIWQFFPIIGTILTKSTIQYLLRIGSQLTWGNNFNLFGRMFHEYGPVVRWHGPFGGDIVIVNKPEHVASIFKSEGVYPVRATIDCLEHYRLKKSRKLGPFLMFGPEWEKFRKTIEQPLHTIIAQQVDRIDESSDRFIARISQIRNRQDEVPATFNQEIIKWSLECLCLVTFNKKMGFLDPCGISPTSDAGELFKGFVGATDAIKRCEFGLHFWKLFNTPAWTALVENCETLDKVLAIYCNRARNSLREKKEAGKSLERTQLSLLEIMLLNEGIMEEDAMTMLLDLMLIGVNAVSHSVAFLFYYLAKNPKCQNKLLKEVADKPDHLTKDILTGMPYLQACIKETLRLRAPVPVLTRLLNNDAIVHNYYIPKGTHVIMATAFASSREEYFEDAQKFIPERWINPVEDMAKFAYIPFGYGAKACLGKDLSETEIGMLVCKVLRKFKIRYYYGELKSTNRLLAHPAKPLKFCFIDREYSDQ